jgi:hypothetical protein
MAMGALLMFDGTESLAMEQLMIAATYYGTSTIKMQSEVAQVLLAVLP